MSQNFLTVNDEVPEQQAHTTYLTDVQVGLARHEIAKPGGEHNTELEEATINFKRISEELKQMQHTHADQMEKLRLKRMNLEHRQNDLKNRMQEQQVQQQRQKEREAQIQHQLEGKRGEIQQELNTVSQLVDQIAGATALLHVLKERNTQYAVYSDFVQQIHFRLNGAKNQTATHAVSELERANQDQQYLQQCLKDVGNRFLMLQNEEKKSQILEEQLNRQYDEVTQQLKKRTEDHRAKAAQMEQSLAELAKSQDQLNSQKELYVQDQKALNLKLHEKTQELSNVQSAIKNLVERIAEMTGKDDRQKTLADRARIEDLLGGRNNRLEKQVDTYYQKSKGLVERPECYKRVIGENLLARMRDVYRLGIFLKDLNDLVRLCRGERIEGQVK